MPIRHAVASRSLRIAVCAVALGCRSEGGGAPPASDPTPATAAKMSLRSAAFGANEAIPAEHTCEGADVSPPLLWGDVPPGTQTFALVVDDPDAPDPAAPERTWVHWVLLDIPASTTALPKDAAGSLPAGTETGKNDWDKTTWGGPCPPVGRHRYFFELYALDTALGLDAPTKAELEAAMTGHVLGRGELVGTYQKSAPTD